MYVFTSMYVQRTTRRTLRLRAPTILTRMIPYEYVPYVSSYDMDGVECGVLRCGCADVQTAVTILQHAAVLLL